MRKEKTDDRLHVAFILDGNGRWATDRGLPRWKGHRKGAEVFKTIARACPSIGITDATFYLFSTENWSREVPEVQKIMDLFLEYLNSDGIREIIDSGARIRFIGDRDDACISDEIRFSMNLIESQTESNNCWRMNIAFNYGGSHDILQAARKLVVDSKSGALSDEDVTWEMFSERLYSGELPPVDLLVRTGGESRLSNFLPVQMAYAELFFLEHCWPDLTPEILGEVVDSFFSRNRTFGGNPVKVAAE